MLPASYREHDSLASRIPVALEHMKIIHVVNELQPAGQKVCLAIGFFDGVHLGHRQVIQPILPNTGASDASAPCKPLVEDCQIKQKNSSLPILKDNLGNSLAQDRGHIYPTVATFNPHTLYVTHGQANCKKLFNSLGFSKSKAGARHFPDFTSEFLAI